MGPPHSHHLPRALHTSLALRLTNLPTKDGLPSGGEAWQIDPIQVSCPTEPWGGSAVQAALLSSAEVLPLTWIQLQFLGQCWSPCCGLCTLIFTI